MMLLLDFAEARVNRRGGKKNHGNHSNNNTDRASRSVIIIIIIIFIKLQMIFKSMHQCDMNQMVQYLTVAV